MKTAIAIRHVAFEDLGSFAPLLAEHGYRLEYREAGMDDLAGLAASPPDLLVVLGGPIGVYDEGDYPFLRDELRLLEQRLSQDRATLGICLGSQLMARALGARVYPGPQKEIGWGTLSLSEAGQASCLRHLAAERTPVLHWHGDTFDLPAGAVRLASSPLYENQAFSWGRRALALQFHVEVTAPGLERWFIGHACEIGTVVGLTVGQLRADTARWSASLQTQARQWGEEWLRELAPLPNPLP
jgi:GMP synthase (glutamine-hydrolysing)